MRYAIFDVNGKLKEIRQDNAPPPNALQLNDSQYAEITNTPATAYWQFSDGQLSKIVPTPPPAVAPTTISMRQARLALLQSGKLAQIDALIAAIPGSDGDTARIEWGYAAEVRRIHPLVASIATALPLTSQQLDDLFTLGASL